MQRQWNTGCMAMASLMAARWVGQNSGPIFRRLWSKVNRIKFACAGVSVVCNAILRLTKSYCVLAIFTNNSQSHQNFNVFGPPNFGGRGHPNFWRNFIYLDHQWTCSKVWWRSAKRLRRLGGEKRRKEDLNYSSKTEWPAGGPLAAIIT